MRRDELSLHVWRGDGIGPREMDSTASLTRPRAIANWLMLAAAMIFAMVVVGGITRLTESGLSITEWKPVSGTVPPIGHSQWEEVFRLYQQTPQYRQVTGP